MAYNIMRISGIETLHHVVILQYLMFKSLHFQHVSHPCEFNVPYFTNWQDIYFVPSVAYLSQCCNTDTSMRLFH